MMDALDELPEDIEQKMKAKLLQGYRPSSVVSGMSDEERRMAEKLLGQSNAERLARTGSGERFKYRRPVHTVEYGYDDIGGGWYVDVFENGKRRPFKADLDEREIEIVLSALRKKGIPVRLFETEAQKQARSVRRAPKPKPGPCHKIKPPSARQGILNSLRDFHL